MDLQRGRYTCVCWGGGAIGPGVEIGLKGYFYILFRKGGGANDTFEGGGGNPCATPELLHTCLKSRGFP